MKNIRIVNKTSTFRKLYKTDTFSLRDTVEMDGGITRMHIIHVIILNVVFLPN